MLTITHDAADALRAVLGAKPGGVRISTDAPSNGTGPSLTMEVVQAPEPEDEVLDTEGTQVFLDPTAADALDGKTLDADREEDAVRFSVLDA